MNIFPKFNGILNSDKDRLTFIKFSTRNNTYAINVIAKSRKKIKKLIVEIETQKIEQTK